MESKVGGRHRIKDLVPNMKKIILTSIFSILLLFVGVFPALATTYSYSPDHWGLRVGVDSAGLVQVMFPNVGSWSNPTAVTVTEDTTGRVLFTGPQYPPDHVWQNQTPYVTTIPLSLGHYAHVTIGYGASIWIWADSIVYNGTTELPSIPTGLSVTGTGSNATLTWSANPAADSVTSYGIYLDGSIVTTQIATSYSFNGLLAGTHSFQVKATNANGSSSLSSTVTYNIPPNAPIPTASNVTTSGATISWLSVFGSSSYDISVNGAFVTNLTTTTYNLSGLLYKNDYTVSVIAKSSVGDSTAGSVTFQTPDLPSPPEGLQITNITSSTLDLSWLAVSGSITYILDQNNTLLATTTNNFYHCSGLSPNTTYTYKVAVTTALGESNYSAPVDAKTLGIPPAAPTGLSAGNITNTSFTLYWLKQIDANSYNVYLDGTLEGSISQPLLYNPSFDISTINEGSTHSMTVTAVNQWGESTASQSLSVTLFPSVPTGLKALNITKIPSTYRGPLPMEQRAILCF